MQLRFIRFFLIISLLTSNEAKLKTKSENILLENKEMNFESSNAFQNSPSLKNNYPKSRLRRTAYIKAILSNPKLSSTQKLTEKLAKKALLSPKNQKEFRKLTLIKTRKRNSHEVMKNPKRKENIIRSIKATKGYYKPVFKGSKRKKRKKHKCGFGLGWCSDSDFSKRDSFKKVPSEIREKAVYKRGVRNPSLELNKTRNPGKAVRESMLEKVMKTTTKDPYKKNPGDQGMEYSEYYNDDDVLNDQVEKIQTKGEDLTNSVIRSEREVAKNLQRNFASVNEDDELDDLNDEAELDGNESDVLLSDSDQNRSRNHVYQQNQFNQQIQPDQRNQIQQNIYQDPYLISGPAQYGRVQQQIGLTPYPQLILYPNQYSNEFTNRNQILSPINKPLNQSNMKVQIKNNQNYKGSNYNGNQALVPAKEPLQFYRGIEVTLLNSTISESTTVGSSTAALSRKKSFPNPILNNFTLSGPYLQSGSQHFRPFFGFLGSKNSNRLDETLAVKYNIKPKNSLVPLIKGNIVEHQNQQQNFTVSKENTQVIANEILSKIVDELEELKTNRQKKLQKEGRPCRISGSWMTSQAGVKLNMKVVNYTIAVIIEKLEPSPSHEGLLNMSWILSGQVPFRHGGPFALTGVDKKTKSLAVFLGSCRVCEGVDTIEGVWTVSREPHDCRDFQMATGIHNDIFRRVKLHNDKRKDEKEKSVSLSSTT